jgi:hypothetical protein
MIAIGVFIHALLLSLSAALTLTAVMQPEASQAIALETLAEPCDEHVGVYSTALTSVSR